MTAAPKQKRLPHIIFTVAEAVAVGLGGLVLVVAKYIPIWF